MSTIIPPYVPAEDLAARLPPNLATWARWFCESSDEHQVDRFILAAICGRESGGGIYLSPKGPTGTGDDGHGRGLMQIDDRAHADWCLMRDVVSGLYLWQIPKYNIDKGASILAANLALYGGDVPASIASYNASARSVNRALSTLPAGASISQRIAVLDQVTTGHDYVSFVLAHRDRFLSTSPVPPKSAA